MAVSQTINSVLRSDQNEISDGLGQYQSRITKLSLFINTKDVADDPYNWNRKYHSLVRDAYELINGAKGYSKECDEFPINHPLIALSMDYMKWMDRAFRYRRAEDSFDSLFSTSGNRLMMGESYDQCCQKLFECHEELFKNGIEFLNRDILDFFKRVLDDMQNGRGQETYTLDVEKSFGPVPEWFYDRMNLYIFYCKNFGGLFRHFAHAIGLNKQYRVTVDYDFHNVPDLDAIRIRVKRNMKFARLLDHRHRVNDNGVPFNDYLIETDTGQKILVAIGPHSVMLELMDRSTTVYRPHGIVLEESVINRINHALSSYATFFNLSVNNYRLRKSLQRSSYSYVINEATYYAKEKLKKSKKLRSKK